MAAARSWGSRAAPLLTGLLITASASLATRALAQPAKLEQPEDVLPLSDLDVDDPIGVDRDSSRLQDVAAQRSAQAERAQRQERADQAQFGPQPPPLSVRAGVVLTAAPSTRETRHRVNVRLEPGSADVELELQFQTQAKKPSELRYRLPVPPGSQLTALEVCSAHACRKALPARPAAARAYEAALLARPTAGARGLPVAFASRVRDEAGEAFMLYAAPITEGQPLSLRVRYLAEAALHGGVARVRLPARGMDPQLAPAEVALRSEQLRDLHLGASTSQSVQLDPWLELVARGVLPSGQALRASATHASCAAGLCASAALWSGSRAAKPVDLVIALDVSPSTEGPARGRLVATIGALLGATPARSQVRALAFAGRASSVLEHATAPEQVPLAPFASAIAEAELGSATRLEAAWALASPWLRSDRASGRRQVIVVVGDGGLTRGRARTFELARAAGVEIVSLNASDQPTAAALRQGAERSGGIALDIGQEAEAAAHGGDPAPLEARLSAVFAPTLSARVEVQADSRRIELGPLRAGEGLSWTGHARAPVVLRFAAGSQRSRASSAQGGASSERVLAASDTWVAIDARDLGAPSIDDWPRAGAANSCERRGPAHRFSGLSSDAEPLALAEERGCRPPPPARPAPPNANVGKGMPSEPLLAMLRQRILPVARGCFRQDRAGQLRYQRRATFVFSLAEREVVSADIDGAIPSELRTCLLDAVDRLEVPRFSGAVNVRYPLITESVPLPEQIELRANTSGMLDRLFGDPVPLELDALGSSLHTPPASNAERVRR